MCSRPPFVSYQLPPQSKTWDRLLRVRSGEGSENNTWRFTRTRINERLQAQDRGRRSRFLQRNLGRDGQLIQSKESWHSLRQGEQGLGGDGRLSLKLPKWRQRAAYHREGMKAELRMMASGVPVIAGVLWRSARGWWDDFELGAWGLQIWVSTGGADQVISEPELRERYREQLKAYKSIHGHGRKWDRTPRQIPAVRSLSRFSSSAAPYKNAAPWCLLMFSCLLFLHPFKQTESESVPVLQSSSHSGLLLIMNVCKKWAWNHRKRNTKPHKSELCSW